MQTITEVTAFIKHLEPLKRSMEGKVALLNTQDDDLIWLVSEYLPETIDIFLVDAFPKIQFAYDNIYTFSCKDFSGLPRGSIKFDIILDEFPDRNKAIVLARYWDRVADNGHFILTNVGDIDETMSSLPGHVPDKIFEDQYMLSYKKKAETQ